MNSNAQPGVPILDVRARTQSLVDLQDDPSREGRPLLALLGGTGVAFLSLVLIGMLVYRTWVLHEIPEQRAYYGVSFLFCFYVLGVFLFCYAYELCDMAKALRLTIIVSFVSVVLIFLVIAALSQISRVKGAANLVSGEGASDGGSAFGVLNMLDLAGGDERTYGRRLKRAMYAGNAPRLIKCRGCGESFIPTLPLAECAYCGRSALTA